MSTKSSFAKKKTRTNFAKTKAQPGVFKVAAIGFRPECGL